MSLRNEQSRFVKMVALLILFAYERGYELTFSDTWSKPEYKSHKVNSNHFVRLAIDLNLFKDGRYITDIEGHDELHDFWDSIGGAPRIEKDMNHYSIIYQGRW